MICTVKTKCTSEKRLLFTSVSVKQPRSPQAREKVLGTRLSVKVMDIYLRFGE